MLQTENKGCPCPALLFRTHQVSSPRPGLITTDESASHLIGGIKSFQIDTYSVPKSKTLHRFDRCVCAIYEVSGDSFHIVTQFANVLGSKWVVCIASIRLDCIKRGAVVFRQWKVLLQAKSKIWLEQETWYVKMYPCIMNREALLTFGIK